MGHGKRAWTGRFHHVLLGVHQSDPKTGSQKQCSRFRRVAWRAWTHLKRHLGSPKSSHDAYELFTAHVFCSALSQCCTLPCARIHDKVGIRAKLPKRRNTGMQRHWVLFAVWISLWALNCSMLWAIIQAGAAIVGKAWEESEVVSKQASW